MANSDGVHYNVVNIVISVAAFLGVCRLFFWLFSPAETLTMVLIIALVLVLYGIQPVIWQKQERVSLFGFTVWGKTTVYQQFRIFGVIPLESPKEVDCAVEILKDAPALVQASASFVGSAVASALPLGGVMLGRKRRNS